MVCLHRRDHKAINSKHTWDCFGGDRRPGEELEEALIRELREELGIAVRKDKIRRIRKWKVSNQAMYRIIFPFRKRSVIRLREGAGFVWLPFDLSEKLSIRKKLKLSKLHTNAIKALEKFQTQSNEL